jgi:effector-binding domain-containing protein
MKKTTMTLILALAAAWLGAQTEPVIRDGEHFVYVCLECRGPYAQMPEKLGILMQEMSKQNLAMEGAPLGIYYTALSQPESEPVWEVAMVVSGNPEVKPPLVKKEFSCSKQAEMTYKGPYTSVGSAYPKLMAFIDQSGFKPNGPALETWMDDPASTRPEDCRTLIIIPVEKRTP